MFKVGHVYSLEIGSKTVICRNFLLTLSVTLKKITAKRNFYSEKLKYIKSNWSKTVQKELSKIIHFQNTSDRVHFSIKVQPGSPEHPLHKK